MTGDSAGCPCPACVDCLGQASLHQLQIEQAIVLMLVSLTEINHLPNLPLHWNTSKLPILGPDAHGQAMFGMQREVEIDGDAWHDLEPVALEEHCQRDLCLLDSKVCPDTAMLTR